MSAPMSEIQERLTALERDVRRWRRSSAVGLLGALVVIAALVAVRMGAIGRQVVEAQSFVLIDAQGRRRGELVMEEKGAPSLGLYDASGTRKLRLALDADGLPRLSMTGPQKTHIWLAVNALGVPEMILHDRQGAQRVELTMDHTGAPALVLLDAAETARAVFGVDHDAAPALLMHGKDASRANLSVLADGSPLLGLQDGEGKVRFRAP
jgi:hypothetical protein